MNNTGMDLSGMLNYAGRPIKQYSLDTDEEGDAGMTISKYRGVGSKKKEGSRGPLSAQDMFIAYMAGRR